MPVSVLEPFTCLHHFQMKEEKLFKGHVFQEDLRNRLLALFTDEM